MSKIIRPELEPKLVMDFNSETGRTNIPVYQRVNISVDDYIVIEFGAAPSQYFEIRITFRSIVEGQFIQIMSAAMPGGIYEFTIRERLENGSQQAIRSEMAIIECPVDTKFRVTVSKVKS